MATCAAAAAPTSRTAVGIESSPASLQIVDEGQTSATIKKLQNIIKRIHIFYVANCVPNKICCVTMLLSAESSNAPCALPRRPFNSILERPKASTMAPMGKSSTPAKTRPIQS